MGSYMRTVHCPMGCRLCQEDGPLPFIAGDRLRIAGDRLRIAGAVGHRGRSPVRLF